MKTLTKRIAAVGVCTALCVGGIAGHAYATSGNTEGTVVLEPAFLSDMSNGVESGGLNNITNVSLGDKNVAGEILSTLAQAGERAKAPVTKDETVYVMTGADGTVSKIIVSDWLKNSEYGQNINDRSILEHIENVKGDETFTTNGDGTAVWNAAGNDIYYTGESSKAAPVEMKITYSLDGKEMTPEEMAGKSGKATIRFDYVNNEKTKVLVDGEEKNVTVPFVAVTGMLLDTDTFRNVEVSNGKLINDGERMAVVGIALPGIDGILESEKTDALTGFEVTADVTDFKLGMTVTIVTNEVFNKLSTEGLNLDFDLSGTMGQLTDAMSQLMDGSSQLYDGLSQLNEKAGELADGVGLLGAGANSLNEGAMQVDAGAKELSAGVAQVDDGVSAVNAGVLELKNGLDTLTSNNDAINGGAKQVFDTLLSTAEGQLKAAGIDVPTLTIENYGKVLDGVIAFLDKDAVYKLAEDTVKAAVEENRGMIEAKVTEAVRAEVEAKVTAAVKMQVEAQVKAVVPVAEMVAPAVEQQMASDEVKALIKANADEQMKTKEVKALIAENVEAQVDKAIEENMSSDAVLEKIKAAEAGVQTIAGLKNSLDSYNDFYTGIKAYTSGVAKASEGAGTLYIGTSTLEAGTAQLSAGADTLAEGTSQLANGAAQLDAGIGQLSGNIPALIDGVGQLKDGAGQLKDGLAKFNEEGIEKITSLINDNLGDLLGKVHEITAASASYNNYSGIGDDMDGSVKFIYRTEEIK